ncbi:MAG TPA: MurR/RpiR family transcriptional regulator [Clostridia bacterium]
MPQTCLARIQNAYPRLTPVERCIADQILAHYAQVVEMSVSCLAAAAGVAPSGIIRFCQKLGYQGFTQLKINLAGQPEPMPDLIMPAVGPDDDTRTVFSKVFQSSIKTLRDTLDMMDPAVIEQAVEILQQAERIVFYGVGTSATIAMDAYYRLMRIGYPAWCSTDSQIMRIAAAGMGPGHVAVGISHSGRTAETIEAMRSSRARGAKTLVITSHLDTPICQHADLVLCIYSDESRYPIEAVSARIAHIAVLDALCVALALKHYDRTIEHVRVMNRLFDNLRGSL